MKKFYKIECLTNLHAGSGDINYNIIDNEVEKDPVTGYPMIHSSGIKGALRDHFKGILSESKLAEVFGKPGNDENTLVSGGKYKFLDACILARPLRAESAEFASLPVFSLAMVNQFIRLCTAFGKPVNGGNPIEAIEFGDNKFLVNCNGIKSIEGERTAKLSAEDAEKFKFLEDIIGKNFAVAKNINEFDLPVLARNCLVEGHENLWFEEVVPHSSIFFFAIFAPDDEQEFALEFNDIVQFGAHSSIGRGYCKVTEI